MNKWVFFSLLILTIFLASIFIIQTKSITTISYFPIDDETFFEDGQTHLKIRRENDSNAYKIKWTTASNSSQPLYLRQDISLLYENGRFKGVQSKWKENTESIHLKKDIYGKENAFFQSISYHHGEVHYPNDQIKSIQQMSSDNLYVVTPKIKNTNKLEKKLDKITKQQLLHYWDQLINHFNIDTESYLSVPLINVSKYNEESLPSFTTEQTNQIIGQLWEGLYKNYVIPTTKTENNQLPHYMPLVLFDKENTHLTILFELNGEKQQLIQRYPD